MSWGTLPHEAGAGCGFGGGGGQLGKTWQRPASSCLHGPCSPQCLQANGLFHGQERESHSIPVREVYPPKSPRALDVPLSSPAVLIMN